MPEPSNLQKTQEELWSRAAELERQLRRITIVGAGMSGSLMAIFLARRGFAVELFERRGDLRLKSVDVGKSIKMTLAERGLAALARVGLVDQALRISIPLRGRAVHSGEGDVTFVPYGKNEHEVIHSISRTDLNVMLLDNVAQYPNVRIHFHHRCLGIDKETASAVFLDELSGEERRLEADALIGADGSFSIVRQQMHRGERVDYQQDFVEWGYKEMTIVGAPDGTHLMDKHALHIWPHGDRMLFALPNLDGSFSAVCILPFTGEHAFDSVRSEAEVLALFEERFADALPLMPFIAEEFASKKTGEFVTLRTSRWHHKGKVVLLGDACHAIIPFYGQGMNAAFEDCATLDGCLERHPGDLAAAFAEFQAVRKKDTDVLGDLSKENFTELRDTMRSAIRVARKRAWVLANRLFPKAVVPIYTMVTHGTLPYAECLARARRQERMARFLGADLLIGVMAIGVVVERARARRKAARLLERRRAKRREAGRSALNAG